MVDVGYERRLANHLGAHRTPSILGVVNGKVTFFNYALAKEHLMQFVEDLLPQRLVEKVRQCRAPLSHSLCFALDLLFKLQSSVIKEVSIR